MFKTEEYMQKTNTRVVIGWCENDSCGEPIFNDVRRVEQVSDAGERYFYCTDCALKAETPDRYREGED